MPICAWRSAGASLAPSPHMPTIWPPSSKALTSLYLSSGKTPAKTANCSGCDPAGIAPGGQVSPSRPTARATIAAVAGGVARHHDRLHAQSLQFGDQRGRVLARRIAEGDQSRKAQAFCRSGRDGQHAKAFVFQLLRRRCRGRGRRRQRAHAREGALDDAKRVAVRRRPSLRTFFVGSKAVKAISLGASDTLALDAAANGGVDRILPAFRTGERSQSKNVRPVEAPPSRGRPSRSVHCASACRSCRRTARPSTRLRPRQRDGSEGRRAFRGRARRAPPRA